MSDDDGTVIEYNYGELTASVSTGQNLSPDFIDTILSDLRKNVVAGARQLGMTYQPVEADATDEA